MAYRVTVPVQLGVGVAVVQVPVPVNVSCVWPLSSEVGVSMIVAVGARSILGDFVINFFRGHSMNLRPGSAMRPAG